MARFRDAAPCSLLFASVLSEFTLSGNRDGALLLLSMCTSGKSRREPTALSSLLAGASFAQVCAALSEQYSDQLTTEVVGTSLRSWLDDELIVGLTGVPRGSEPGARESA